MIAREPADRQQSLGRRSVLLGAAALGLLSGCTGQAGSPPAAETAATAAQQARDAAAVEAARKRSAALLAAAELAAAAASSSSGVATLNRVAADHRAHLAALGVTGSGAAANSPSATAPGLASAELDGAREALADATGVSQGTGVSAQVTVLVTRIAASRAAHADLLGADVPDPLQAPGDPSPPAPPAPGSPSPGGRSSSGLDDSAATQTARQALTRLIEDLHAAVYGYGMVAAKVGEADVARAEDDWARHRSRRDAYTAALLGLGGRVPAALSAYQVGAVTDAVAAAALAVRIETALTTRLLATLAQVEPPLRGMVAGDVVAAVLRTQRWGGTVPALPGSPSPG